MPVVEAAGQGGVTGGSLCAHDADGGLQACAERLDRAGPVFCPCSSQNRRARSACSRRAPNATAFRGLV